VPVEEASIGADRDQRVVQRGPAELAFPFLDPADHYDTGSRRGFPNRPQLI
jgi:hypothetical protein